ncbi:MAG: MBL fold metallo-hydrolase, partial [Spirochaetales bacterium]|nr:MBL fold metallo-hydrolase [Spirochaetales bacterium]
EEYDKDKMGWGHSPIEFAIRQAKRAKVKSMALFHHDPMRTDKQLDELTNLYCRETTEHPLTLFFAKEGVDINL